MDEQVQALEESRILKKPSQHCKIEADFESFVPSKI